MATYATLTVPVLDIIGADFNASRASVWIEPNVPVILADSIRVGGRREQVVNGVATFANLVTTNSADNPASFGYRVTITAPPKGAAGRKDIVNLTTADFPFTATANLKNIPEAWDNIVLPVEWRSAFRDEMEALRDETATISGLTGEDAAVAFLVEDSGSATAGALSATYAARTSGGKGLARVVNRSDYASLAAAITAAGSYGTVHYDEGTSWNEPPTTISIPVTIEGRGVRIYKNANGAMLTITAADVRIGRGLWLIGNAPTYTGPGIVVTGNGTTSRPIIECRVSNCEEWALDFGIGAGQVARIESSELGSYVRSTADAAMTSGSAVLTSATAAFTARDVGKYALVEGALRTDQPTWHLLSRIVSVDSATQVTLADTAGATTSAADLQYGHPAIRFGAEYAVGVNGDRTIVNPYAGGWLLADIGGAQNLNIIGGNFRNVVYSDAQSAKVSITGARIATSGSPVALKGVSHVFTANTCAGDIIATADAAQANIAGNVASGSVLDYGADTIVDGSVNAHPPHTMDPRALLNTGTLNANQTVYLRAKGRGYVSKIGLHVSASSGNICVAVYGNNGSAGTAARPAARKATSGSVVCPAVGYAEVALTGPVYVEEGDWIALSADNATAAFYRGGAGGFTSNLANGTSHFQSATFPCPATAAASVTGAVYSFVMTGVI